MRDRERTRTEVLLAKDRRNESSTLKESRYFVCRLWYRAELVSHEARIITGPVIPDIYSAKKRGSKVISREGC